MRWGVVLSTLVLAGCAHKQAADAERAKTDLIGRTKADVLACMGVPARSAASGGTEVLAYSTRGENDVTIRRPNDASLDLQPSCVATIAITDGKVSRVAYQGNTGGILSGGDPVCAELVRACLR